MENEIISEEYIIEQMYNYRVMQMNMEDELKAYINETEYEERELDI